MFNCFFFVLLQYNKYYVLVMCSSFERSLLSDYLIRYDAPAVHTLLTPDSLFELLGDKFDKVINRLIKNKGQNLTVKPFHGHTIVFYYR